MGLFIKIINDGSGDAKIGNYNYNVQVNEKLIASGHIKNFKRSRGWRELLRVLADADENKQMIELLGDALK